jgi:hypothetical protein
MDRKYIENEHVVERYLAGELTVREAREFEQYCLDHPDVLQQMPIPVRLKARLSRRPSDDSETGIFRTIPSSATRTALEVADEGLDEDDEPPHSRWSGGGGGGVSRAVLIVLVLALIGAIAGLVTYGMRASALAEELRTMKLETHAIRMQPPASVSTHRIQPVRVQPNEPTLHLGWLAPPQLLELHIDVSEGKFTQFQITIDKVDEGRLLQIRRLARDSNRELRLALNSSAFGPGEYVLRLDAYDWRGQTQEYGWIRLGLN